MAASRFVVLGLAPPRSPWFSAVAQWSDAGALPVEFAKCVSVEELRARLQSGRSWSAALVDGRLPGADRDLLAKARAARCAVVVVAEPTASDSWLTMGADAVLAPDFGPRDLLDALTRIATAVDRRDADGIASDGTPHTPAPSGWGGVLVAVLGPGGTGASTAAIALAQTLAQREGDAVVLADLALRAEQAVLHDAKEVAPGIQELVDAHRRGSPGADAVRQLTFAVETRGYDLLLGLRRPEAWSTLRPRAVAAAIDSLRHAYAWTVADVDATLEGEADTGSVDVEERHALARAAAARADVVLAVGTPGLKGAHALVRTLHALDAFGVPAERVVPVVSRAPRSVRSRAEFSAAVGALRPDGAALVSPVFLPTRKVDEALRDGVRLHASLGSPLVGAVDAVLRLHGERALAILGEAVDIAEDDGAPVIPGSLGHLYSLDEDEDEREDGRDGRGDEGDDEHGGPEAAAG